jgi:hypothetical protein
LRGLEKSDEEIFQENDAYWCEHLDLMAETLLTPSMQLLLHRIPLTKVNNNTSVIE